MQHLVVCVARRGLRLLLLVLRGQPLPLLRLLPLQRLLPPLLLLLRSHHLLHLHLAGPAASGLAARRGEQRERAPRTARGR